MTVTTNEHGQQNMFAREPKMYISDADAIKYGMMTHNERAELANSRWAMLGFIAGIVSYVATSYEVEATYWLVKRPLSVNCTPTSL